MARVCTTIAAEMDALHDAVRLLCDVHAALARRHGDRFRALERRIESLMDNFPLSDADLHFLDSEEGGAMLFTFTVPTALRDLLDEARRLGVAP